MSKQSKNILFIMTGSIACYKACSIISALHQKGFQIKVVMSPSSLEFIGASTIEGLTGKIPITNMHAPGSVMDHIHLIRWADLVLVAPATANYLNKIAAGLGDDLLTTLFLAHDFKKPFLVAPAMNTMMYLHPTVQHSISQLKKYGVEILETASGVLACGEVGFGKLLEPQLIIQEVENRISDVKESSSASTTSNPLKKIKILITAGGTSEPIDDVRILTNKSTGKTGAYLADQLIQSGFDVHFLHATSSQLPKSKCDMSDFSSFSNLEMQLKFLLSNNSFDWVLHAAAVSDYSVVPKLGKISSESEDLTLKLKKNKKLISEIKKYRPSVKLIGFKLTSNVNQKVVDEKVQKLFAESHCDYIIQNDWSNINTGKQHFNFYNPNLSFKEFNNIQNLSFHLFKTFNQESL